MIRCVLPSAGTRSGLRARLRPRRRPVHRPGGRALHRTVLTPTVLTLGLPALGLPALTGCHDGTTVVRGSGAVVQERRDLTPLSRVDVEGEVDLAIQVVGAGPLPESSGPPTQVWIEGAANLLEYMRTDVRGETLVIRCAPGIRLVPRPTLEVRIGRLEALIAAGSGHVTIDGLGSGDHPSSELLVTAAGSLDVHAAGELESLRIEHSGSGLVDFAAVRTQRIDVDGRGSGDAAVHAEEAVDVRLSGSGDLRIHGDPERTNEFTEASGRVVRDPLVRLKPSRAAEPERSR